MGLKPSFSLTANDKNITALVTDRLSSLVVVTETEQQSDELTLILWNTDRNQPLKKPPVGAVLSLALGYEGTLQRMGQFVVSSLSGRGGKMQGRVMEIRARAAPYSDTPSGVTGFQTQKTRSWLKGTSTTPATANSVVENLSALIQQAAGTHTSPTFAHILSISSEILSVITDEAETALKEKLDVDALNSGLQDVFVGSQQAERGMVTVYDAIAASKKTTTTTSTHQDAMA